jgi:hemin uptake protein HemP
MFLFLNAIEVASHLQIDGGYVLKFLQCEDGMQAKTAKPKPVRKIALSDLLEGRREAVLLHDGAEYRLRLTSNGKLILTK